MWELDAVHLPAHADEPLAPPPIRTTALLGFLPKQFPGRKWRDHVYLFDPGQAVVEQEATAGKKRVRVEWLSAPLDAAAPLAEVDALGLQVVPLSERSKRDMWLLPDILRRLAQTSRNFPLDVHFSGGGGSWR